MEQKKKKSSVWSFVSRSILLGVGVILIILSLVNYYYPIRHFSLFLCILGMICAVCSIDPLLDSSLKGEKYTPIILMFDILAIIVCIGFMIFLFFKE